MQNRQLRYENLQKSAQILQITTLFVHIITAKFDLQKRQLHYVTKIDNLRIAVFLRLVRGRAAGLRSVTGWDTYFCIAKFLAQLMYLTSTIRFKKNVKAKTKRKR